MAEWLVEDTDAMPLIALTKEDVGDWLPGQSPTIEAWVAASGFEGKPATYCLVPDAAGEP
nr:leucyl aminopeptidase family protein [Alphaproteobacteria bacterium]